MQPLERVSDLGLDAARAQNRSCRQPRNALAMEGTERRWSPRFEVLRCTGRLNATQPESCRQHSR